MSAIARPDLGHIRHSACMRSSLARQTLVKNVMAIQMSRSILVHLSFTFHCSCQADFRHILSRWLT